MLEKITRNWWMFALRGVAAVIFGLLALIWPEQTLLALVMLFGAYALVDGIFAMFTGRALGSRLAGVCGARLPCWLPRPALARPTSLSNGEKKPTSR